MLRPIRCTECWPGNLNARDTLRACRDACVARFETSQAKGLPYRLFQLVMHEALALKPSLGVGGAVGQAHLMINRGNMFCRHADLYHFDVVAGKQNTMANFRRLDHTGACGQSKRLTLVFINQIDPTAVAKYQLKPNGVVMHHIRDWAAIRNADVAGNDRPTKAVRDKIAVVHARPAYDPRCLIGEAPHHKAVNCFGHFHGWVQRFDFDPRSVRGGQDTRTVCKSIGVIGENAQRSCRFDRVRIDPYAQAMPRKHCHSRVISRIDHIHS